MKRYQVYLNPHSVSVINEVAEISDVTRSRILQEMVEAAASRAGNLLAMIKKPNHSIYSELDKYNIRYVYHYNLPKSLENYYQEIGRADRDGQPSLCQLLASSSDINVLQNFVYGDTPDETAVSDFLDFIFQQPDEFDVSIRELSNTYDIRELVVKTLLVYLELENIIDSTSPFYNL